MNKSRKNKRTRKNKTKKIRTRKNRNKRKNIRKKNTIGGVKIYNMDGTLTEDASVLHKGKDFFRKMTDNVEERKICEILMTNPHKNIVKIYKIGTDYIDMELLNIDINTEDMTNIKNVMMDVKTYLQSLGIMYIDWKLDNIGISENGQYKLFDFDASGLIDIKTKEWKIKPPTWWFYNKAVQNGMVTPSEIDDYGFDNLFK